ncbi:MAG: hypothetical protein HZA11_09125 [Nitrospirae bacterium]|nr:hypothetical protein [Nitrospirota bacterium]
MKILITGSKGMLAQDLIPLLREGHEVMPYSPEYASLSTCDLRKLMLRC